MTDQPLTVVCPRCGEVVPAGQTDDHRYGLDPASRQHRADTVDTAARNPHPTGIADLTRVRW